MERLPGVKKVIIRFRTKHCFVRFDPARQRLATLIKAIEKQGHKAVVDKKARWPKSGG